MDSLWELPEYKLATVSMSLLYSTDRFTGGMNRRSFLAAAAGSFLAGCGTPDDPRRTNASDTQTPRSVEIGTTTSHTQTTRPPVDSLERLVDRLSTATAGDTVTVPPDAEIDLSNQWEIQVPSGVTLEGGRDAKNNVPGALLTSPTGDKTPKGEPTLRKLILEPNARLTGFRLQSHFTEYVNPATEHNGNFYAHRGGGGVTASHKAEVDNNEISGWPYAAVVLHGAGHIHDNDIHHNTWEGLGYGVAVPGGTFVPIIESNYFNYNRHSITAAGSAAGYVARYNVVGPDWVGAQFDVHGTEGMEGIAGRRVIIEQNTFKATTTVEAKTRLPDAKIQAIQFRGTPSEGAWIRQNWFYHDDKESAVWNPNSYENIHFDSNHYGETPPTQNSVGAPATRSRLALNYHE